MLFGNVNSMTCNTGFFLDVAEQFANLSLEDHRLIPFPQPEEVTRPNSLLELPQEILDKVMSRLQPPSLVAFSCVSRRCSLFVREYLTRMKTFTFYRTVQRPLASILYQLKGLRKCSFKDAGHLNQSLRLLTFLRPEMMSLTIEGCSLSSHRIENLRGLQALEDLTLNRVPLLKSTGIRWLVQNHQRSLRRLTIKNSGAIPGHCFDQLESLTKLEELEVEPVLTKRRTDKESLVAFLKQNRGLKQLCLRLSDSIRLRPVLEVMDSLEVIDVDPLEGKDVDLLMEKCPQLKSLRFGMNVIVTKQQFQRYAMRFAGLHEIHLEGDNRSLAPGFDAVTDLPLEWRRATLKRFPMAGCELLDAICQRAPYLQSLDVFFLKKPSNLLALKGLPLKELSLRLPGLDAGALTGVLSSSQLTRFSFRGAENIDVAFVKSLPQSLTALDISNPRSIDLDAIPLLLSRLHRLREFKCSMWFERDRKVKWEEVLPHLSRMRVLDLSYWPVDHETLREIEQNCRDLEAIDLTGCRDFNHRNLRYALGGHCEVKEISKAAVDTLLSLSLRMDVTLSDAHTIRSYWRDGKLITVARSEGYSYTL